VVVDSGNLAILAAISSKITGTFRANPKGFGFVVPLEPASHGDLFIPPGEDGGAMTGDIVIAKVFKKGKAAGQMQYRGQITEILQRAQNRFVGTLRKTNEGWVVQPDGVSFFELIAVDDISAKNARNKDKVVVEILSYPTQRYFARGVITEVLGRSGQYESEIQSIIHQYHLPREFDEDCIEQARRAAAEFNPEKVSSREDITEKVIVTIDPPDAKDFDDAISLEKDSDGNWMLGVHIADVSFFVTADSPLDAEAKTRGNSIYLPGRTIPMLPEILSNGICSLQPEQKRFVKSVYMTYDDDGNVLSRRFVNSVMCSTKRLTYQQVDKVLKGHTKGVKPMVIELLKDMETLSRLIEKRRTEDGMIHLELPETELVMDKSGRVVDAHPADNSYPHTIIEMFMVEANEAVAGLLNRLKVPFMRRIHPEPDSLSMKNLSMLIRAFGYSLGKNAGRRAIQELLAAVKGADREFAVNLAVLRSLEKAEYSPLNIGHYALASNRYCHFTSPIRRYADLLVHRLLESYLQKRSVEQQLDLTEIGKHISFTEERAEDAEEELKVVLILQMLEKHMGDELDCVVSGTANFGVFVQSRKFGIEGFIQMADLGPDVWRYNQKSQCVIGQRSGCSIHLGRAIKVRIISVNVAARQLNVVPLRPLVIPPAGAMKGKAAKKTKRAKRAGNSR
jgi:ribonuclease R